MRAIIETPPTTKQGVAIVAAVLWDIARPERQPGSADYQESAARDENRLIAALWRYGNGLDGLPPTADADESAGP